MTDSKPKTITNIVEQQLGDEILLYNATGEVVHILNRPAYRIWQRCDGRHTLADIASDLRQAFDVPPDTDLDQAIRDTLQMLDQKQLLQSPEPA